MPKSLAVDPSPLLDDRLVKMGDDNVEDNGCTTCTSMDDDNDSSSA